MYHKPKDIKYHNNNGEEIKDITVEITSTTYTVEIGSTLQLKHDPLLE